MRSRGRDQSDTISRLEQSLLALPVHNRPTWHSPPLHRPVLPSNVAHSVASLTPRHAWSARILPKPGCQHSAKSLSKPAGLGWMASGTRLPFRLPTAVSSRPSQPTYFSRLERLVRLLRASENTQCPHYFPWMMCRYSCPRELHNFNVHADAWTFGTHCTLELRTQPHSLELLVHTVDGWCEDAGLHVAALAAGQQPQQRNVGGAWQLVQQVVD